VEARDPDAVFLSRQQHVGASDGLRQPERFFGGGHRNEGLGSAAQGRAHRSGCPQDIDHEYDAAVNLAAAQATRRQENVDLHDSGRSR
jgi:hypothetical protein